MSGHAIGQLLSTHRLLRQVFDPVCILVCDGLTGLPDAVGAMWPRRSSKRVWSIQFVTRSLTPAGGTGPSCQGSQAHLHRRDRGGRLRALSRPPRAVGGPLPGHRENVGELVGGVHTVPGLRAGRAGGDLHHERIESMNARIRKAAKARVIYRATRRRSSVYLALMSVDPTGRGCQRWSHRWKGALNAFTIAFPDGLIIRTK